jgi:hypothetical protein
MRVHILNSYLGAKYSDGYYEADNIFELMEAITVRGVQYSHADMVKTYALQYGNKPQALKESSPMVMPYTLKDDDEKIVKTNIRTIEALVLDIDNGTDSEACTVQEFIGKNFQFEYYLYTTIKHLLAGGDHRFRVVIPLESPEGIEIFSERKESIFEFFSNGGKTYVDKTSFATGRGFIVPVETEHYVSHYNKGKLLDLGMFERVEGFKATNFVEMEVIEGMDDCPEIIEWANKYRSVPKGCTIELNGESYGRNAAFFRILREIAKYGITVRRHLELAQYMDVDGERGRGTKRIRDSVMNARKTCTTISLAGMNKLREPKEEVIVLSKHLESKYIEIEEGKSHLIISPTGTGKTHFWMKTYAGGKQVIYAAPQNGILDQQKLKHPGAEVCKGTSHLIPSNPRLLCSYNRVLNMAAAGTGADNSVIVLDECHRILTDGFRAGVMSAVTEVVEASNTTSVYMSGTFSPADLSFVDFDHVYRFTVERECREIQVVQHQSKTTHAVLELLEQCGDNVLILLDNVPSGRTLKKYLGDKATLIFSDSRKDKTDEERRIFKEFLKHEQVKGIVITTQVLLEGIDLHGITDMIIVDNPTTKWGCGQMVQFYGRDRDWVSKCWYLRKNLPEVPCEISEFPSPLIEREYLNKFYDDAVGGRLSVMRDDLGAVDVDKLLRVEGTEVYMNAIYPDIKAREYRNVIEHSNDYKGLFEEFNYTVIDGIEILEDRKFGGLADIEEAEKVEKKRQEDIALYSALEGECVEGFEKLYNLVICLKEEHQKSVEEIIEIFEDSKVKQGYIDRLKSNNSQLETGVYNHFEIGKTYDSDDIKDKLTEILDADDLAYVKKRANHHIKTLGRFFVLKRKKKGKAFLIQEKITVVTDLTF